MIRGITEISFKILNLVVDYYHVENESEQNKTAYLKGKINQLLVKIEGNLTLPNEIKDQIHSLRGKIRSTASTNGELDTEVSDLAKQILSFAITHKGCHPNLKNEIACLEMELRRPNELLDSLNKSQKIDLCNFNSPIENLGKIVETLGKGDYGIVFKMEIAGKHFAVKKGEVDDDFKFGKDLDHPNLVKVWMIVEKMTGNYLFLEYIPGKVVGEYTFSPLQRLELISQAAAAGLHIDQKRLNYFDLTPHNMMIDEDRLVIIDLGAISNRPNRLLQYCKAVSWCLGKLNSDNEALTFITKELREVTNETDAKEFLTYLAKNQTSSTDTIKPKRINLK